MSWDFPSRRSILRRMISPTCPPPLWSAALSCLKTADRRRKTRRLRHYAAQDDPGFSRLPDLILLDGGQGHVNTIAPVIQQFGLHIPLFGMVKDQKHRTRAISTGGGEISLAANRSNPPIRWN